MKGWKEKKVIHWESTFLNLTTSEETQCCGQSRWQNENRRTVVNEFILYVVFSFLWQVALTNCRNYSLFCLGGFVTPKISRFGQCLKKITIYRGRKLFFFERYKDIFLVKIPILVRYFAFYFISYFINKT